MQIHRVIKRTAKKLKFMPPRIHKETETETERVVIKKSILFFTLLMHHKLSEALSDFLQALSLSVNQH
jgi:hypothetical protein